MVVSVVFMSYAMQIGYFALGFMWVLGFFLIVSQCTMVWGKEKVSDKVFANNLFWTALALRAVWVIVSYFFYIQVTGTPFEFQARDSVGYHLDAEWMAGEPWSSTWTYLFGGYVGISDSGYPLYLTVLYKIFGAGIIFPRLINALLSAWTCLLVYRMSSRTFGEEVGRMAGIMMVFMPNLIIYCGYHLKETVMLFLTVACLERIEYLTRSPKMSFVDFLLPSLLAGSLFLFRTALGAAAVFAFGSTVMVSSAPAMKRGGKRVALIAWGIVALFLFGGSTIMTEVEALWEGRGENLENKRAEQTIRGNKWAQYATGAVMAPMIFVLPFATMVDVDQQYGQQAKSGGNYIRNFMGFFAILALYEAFRRKKWRDFVPIGAFVIAYLGVVASSGFSNSERFLLPGLPCLIMMWAYGISTLRTKTFKFLNWWCLVVFAMEVAWAYFKLGSRGIL
ncbi:MAG: glycosyltransferase family 39 protein [Bacteroidales bacterium]|nr:glycosyltransferase family 39 protein [Bacteroidales bacterium]